MHKRGQVTIYVVTGIIVLSMVVFVVAFRNQVFRTAWDIEYARSLEIPEKAQDVQNIILDCIGEISEEGVSRLASQGGYINLPEEISPQSPGNRFSNALNVLPGSDIRVAYWSYVSANNVPKRAIPSIESMQKELASYLDSNLARCINNLTSFDYDVVAGQVSTAVEIEPDRIKYTISFPLHVKLEDFEFNFPVFYYEQRYKLGELYRRATELVNNLEEKASIEEKTIDALSVYQSIPFSGTDTSCAPKIWLKPNVEIEIKKALSLNLPFLRVRGTSFSQGNRYFVIDALSGNNDDINLKFDYIESWPFYMDVHPSEGIVLKTEPIVPRNMKELSYISSLICLTDYRFIYDLRFPVLVTLQDTESGDLLQFAYLAVIDNNQPREDTKAEDIEPNTNLICSSLGSRQTVSVIETGEGTPVPSENAKVLFKCVNALCNIGDTGTSSPKGVLDALFPQCVNGFVLAEKEGYVSSKEQVDTVESGNQVTVSLQKLKELNANIILLDNGFERNPSENEDVTITLVNEESEYATTITSEERRIRLIPGRYRASSLVISSSETGFEIPGREITRCVNVPVRGIAGIFGAEEERCFTAATETVSLDSVIIGGSEQEFVLPNAVYSSTDITFYVPVTKIPTTPEQLSGIVESVEIGTKTRPPRLA